MATLLIETKEVRALVVQFDDLAALVKAAYRTEAYIQRQLPRAEMLVDMGRVEKKAFEPSVRAAFNEELKAITPFMTAELWLQDLVNLGELPEAHYLINYGKKPEFVPGDVKDYVKRLEAELKAKGAVPA
jgi:hypothetical protein